MDWKELVTQAKKLVEEGKLDEAEELKKKAEALKELETLGSQEPGTSEPAKKEPVRLDLTGGDTNSGGDDSANTDKAPSDGQKAVIQAWYVKRFGELPDACRQITKELYGTAEYEEIAWMKQVDFRRYLRWGIADPKLARILLLTPQQILDAAAGGVGIKEMKTTMIEADDVLGGYVAPEDFRASVIERLPGLTVVRPLANVITTSRDMVEFPVTTGGNSRYPSAVRVTWVDEVPTAGDSTTNATWGQSRIPIHTVMADSQLSRNLVEDAAFDLAAYMSRQFSMAMAIDEDQRFLRGSGVGTPQGVLKDSTTGGPFDSNTTTVNSGNASALTADGIVKIETGLDGQYRQAGAVFVMAKATRQAINLLKDGQGVYLFADRANALATGPQNVLRGYPIKESEAMPSVTANYYPIIFGDFGGYTIADRIGMAVERYLDSTLAKTNSIAYVVRRRLGGQVTEGWRFVVQKVSA